MDYIQVEVSTSNEAVEIISQVLEDCGSKGVLIENPRDFQFQDKTEKNWDFASEDVFKFGHDYVAVIGYFNKEEYHEAIENLKNKLNKLKEDKTIGLDLGELQVKTKEIYEEDWANNWKKFFDVTKVSNSIVIRPSWKEYTAKEGEKVIDLDPGMAFGTGDHETTRMCIQAIEKYIKKDDTVADIGCGSAILSIASALLGASHIDGVDIDKVAVEVSNENTQLNKVEDKITIMDGTIEKLLGKKYKIVVANIIAEIICDIINQVDEIIEKDGIFICSGIITRKSQMVKDSLKELGFELLEENIEKDWVCLVAKKH